MISTSETRRCLKTQARADRQSYVNLPSRVQAEKDPAVSVRGLGSEPLLITVQSL